MHIGHGCLCVCLSVCPSPHFHTTAWTLDVSWGNGRGCPLVVQYWSDLQSVHGFHCNDNIAPNTKSQRVLVLTLCLVFTVFADWLLYVLLKARDRQLCRGAVAQQQNDL